MSWLLFEALAPLLIYPDGDLALRAAYFRERLDSDEPDGAEPDLAALVEESLRFLETQPQHLLEELYTRTFDLNPISTLEIGWHLYGEQYERGRFLVRAREMLCRVEVEEDGELPDFLPSLLRALPRLSHDEAIDLGAYLLPAVSVMCDALADKDKGNPYHAILEAVRQALAARVPDDAVASVEARRRLQPRSPKENLVEIGGSRKEREP